MYARRNGYVYFSPSESNRLPFAVYLATKMHRMWRVGKWGKKQRAYTYHFLRRNNYFALGGPRQGGELDGAVDGAPGGLIGEAVAGKSPTEVSHANPPIRRVRLKGVEIELCCFSSA